MNRKEAKEIIPILQAYADGAELEERTLGISWSEHSGDFMPDSWEYRIKPEPREFWVCPDVTDRYVIRDNCVSTRCFKVREVIE